MTHRNTMQRQAIVDAIDGDGGHLTADEIYIQVRKVFPRISLGTVYRNLRVLSGQGRIRELDFGLSVTYYESTREPHYHLVCRNCHSIRDIMLPKEADIIEEVRNSRKLDGFIIEEHRLDFIGLCSKCRKKGTKLIHA